MNKRDQARIVRQMCRSMRDYMLDNLHRVPPTWNGIQLREWFADTARERFAVLARRDRSTKRAYRNDRLTQNL